jgi:CheY-like chemotaxis protein
VVDDDPGFLDAVRGLLGDDGAGFRVDTVPTGCAALDFLSRRPPFREAPRPAFVVLDFRLPDLNAPAVLERMRRAPELRSLPVLVMSQADSDPDRAAALTAGARAFRRKPSRVQQLREILLEFWTAHGDDPADRG